MPNFLRWSRRLFLQSPSPKRDLKQSGFSTLSPAVKIEEERLPWYKPDQVYAVRIGEVFHSRYQVLGKLGYGAFSTVWLCRDLQDCQYVTLKVHERDSGQESREVGVYRHLNSLTTSHIGALLVRTSLDDFEISTPDGRYPCLVLPPLGISLFQFRDKMPGKRMSEELLKTALYHLLLALDFLHTEANVIHTDIQEKNILLGIVDQTILAHFEEDEKADPSPRKIDNTRIIYQSRTLRTPNEYGRPILCDFGEARFGSPTFRKGIQPDLYRAPEVLLRVPWDCKVDIWNVGVLAWDLFENQHLFKAEDSNREYSKIHHLAEMIALLGPPPKEFLQRSDYTSKYFDNDGNWSGGIEIPPLSLEGSENFLQGPNKEPFLQFMRKVVQWLPEARLPAKELLTDPWLMAD